MTMNEIVAQLEAARNKGRFAYVEVTIPGQQATEYIVNACESIENKIAYYKRAYDENGVHRNCADIKIVSAGDVADLMNTLFGHLFSSEQRNAEANLNGA